MPWEKREAEEREAEERRLPAKRKAEEPARGKRGSKGTKAAAKFIDLPEKKGRR